MQVTGQLIDNRLPFGLRFRGVGLAQEAARALSSADVIVSSHPPWPVHLGAWFAARRFFKPWVADYRDQWSDNHMFPGSALSASVERRLERKLLSRAAAVTVVSRPMEDYYRAYHGTVVTIENGYDAEAFEKARAVPDEAREGDARQSLRYLGTITRDRIPRNLLAALRSLPPETRRALRVEFYGDCRLLAQVMRRGLPGPGRGGRAPQGGAAPGGAAPHAFRRRAALRGELLFRLALRPGRAHDQDLRVHGRRPPHRRRHRPGALSPAG